MQPNEIIAAREGLDITTKAEMARILDTPYRTYQDWELGNSRPPAMLKAVFGFLLIYKKQGLDICNL